MRGIFFVLKFSTGRYLANAFSVLSVTYLGTDNIAIVILCVSQAKSYLSRLNYAN